MAPDVGVKPLVIHTDKLTDAHSSNFDEPGRGNTTWHTLISAPTTATTSMSAGIAVCPANGTLALHRHKQAEIYYILEGSGHVEIDGERKGVSKGMMLWIPGDAEHGVFCGADETLKWMYIFPEGSFDNVVYRFRHEEAL